MITRKRFKELVKQKGVVWYVTPLGAQSTQLGINDETDFCASIICKDMYETKEECEKSLSMAAQIWVINPQSPPIGTLPLMAYEDFCRIKAFNFTTKYGLQWSVKCIGPNIIVESEGAVVFKEPLNEENYEQALEVCKKMIK